MARTLPDRSDPAVGSGERCWKHRLMNTWLRRSLKGKDQGAPEEYDGRLIFAFRVGQDRTKGKEKNFTAEGTACGGP